MRKLGYIVLFCLFGCVDDELCVGTGTNFVQAQFRDFTTNELRTVTFTDITASGMPEEFPSYADSSLTSIAMSLDPNRSETTYYFTTADRKDTLTLGYSVVPRMISPACGPEFTFRQLVLLNHTFDSVAVVESTIDPEVTNNLNIYY